MATLYRQFPGQKDVEEVNLPDSELARATASGWSSTKPVVTPSPITVPTPPANDFVGNFDEFKKKLGITSDTFHYASEQTKAQEAEAARLAAMRAAINSQATRERDTAQQTAVKREGGRKALLGISEGLNATSYGQDYVEQVDKDLKSELGKINDLETEALANAQYTSADKLSQQLTQLRSQRDQVNQKIIDNFKTYQDYQSSQQPSDYQDYNFYVTETQKSGGTPLSYFEWKAKQTITKPIEVGGNLVNPDTGEVIYKAPEKTTTPITKQFGKEDYQWNESTQLWDPVKKTGTVTPKANPPVPVDTQKEMEKKVNKYLSGVVGADQKVAPETWLLAKQAWIADGGNPTVFDTKFKGYKNVTNLYYQ